MAVTEIHEERVVITLGEVLRKLDIRNQIRKAAERHMETTASNEEDWTAFCNMDSQSLCGLDCQRVLSLVKFLEIQCRDCKKEAAGMVLKQCYLYYFG